MNIGSPPPVRFQQPQMNVRQLRQDLRTEVAQNPEKALKTTGAQVTTRSGKEVTSRRKLQDVDAQLARMDQVLAKHGQTAKLTPQNIGSKFKIFAKVLGNALLKLPTLLVSTVKNSLKLAVNSLQVLRVFTLPFRAMGMGAADKFLADKVFGNINKGLEAGAKWLNDKYETKVGLKEKPENSHVGDAANTLGTSPVGMVADWKGTNVLTRSDGRLDLTTTSNPNPGQTNAATGNDGAGALHMGALFTATGSVDAVDQLSNAIDMKVKGKELEARGQELLKKPELSPQERAQGEFMVEQGKLMQREASGTYTQKTLNLEQNLMGATNLLFGSGYMNASVGAEAATAVTNITQMGLGIFSVASNSVDCAIDSVQASRAKGRVKKCTEFLKATAQWGPDKTSRQVASQGVEEVRDSVKLYKKNQQQTRNLKIFTAVRSAALVVAGAVAFGLMAAAVANPVGLALAGVAAGVAIGVCLYKGYKGAVRQQQTAALEERKGLAQNVINSKLADMGVDSLEKAQTKLGELKQQGSGLKTQVDRDNEPHLQAIASLTEQRENATPGARQMMDTRIANLQRQVETNLAPLKDLNKQIADVEEAITDIGTLKELVHEINSSVRQNDPQAAKKALLQALHGPDEAGRASARVALSEVFKINPDVLSGYEEAAPALDALRENRKNASPAAQQKMDQSIAELEQRPCMLAAAKLEEKMGLFYASVFQRD
ncbi:MAG: hypothetical protein CVV27_14355 [Candidatus Melainabacteria bacterium HGW-Melainabacteria-1]|nr:MAG: hypothetical protein CVV27_14355 [Candidatus Melainabacteria bacterium HGW-Melainabacteria-1]